MIKYALRSALAILTPFAVCGPVMAGTVSFFDGTFNPSNWTVTNLEAGSYSVTQIASGGDPGPYQEVVLNPAAFNDIAVMSAFTYTPSTQGAIQAVIMSLSTINLGTSTQGDGLLIGQGSGWWYAGYGDTNGSWQTLSTGIATASDWALASGSGTLNFTSTGGTITFGYLAANTASGSSAGIDNFSVTVDSIPEPVSLTLLGVGVLCTLYARHRVKRFREDGRRRDIA
jgi:hypothetical protein